MKNTALMVGLSLAIVTGSVSGTLASDERSGGHEPRHSFEELDANGDGQLLREEFQAHMAQRFAAADADGNGALSADELKARAAERKAKRAEKHVSRMIERHDADGDGELTMSEMQARHKHDIFAQFDTDKDDALSAGEFDAMRDEHRSNGKHRKCHGEDE